VYTNQAVTDPELTTTPLTNGCRSDDMLGPLRSQQLGFLYRSIRRPIAANNIGDTF